MRAKTGNAIRDSRIDALETAQRFDQKLIEACHHAMTVLGDKSKAYAELIASLQAENERLKADLEKSDAVVFTQAVENERLKAEVERLRKAGDAVLREWSMGDEKEAHNYLKALVIWNAAKEGKQS